jgi:hypothetical protein
MGGAGAGATAAGFLPPGAAARARAASAALDGGTVGCTAAGAVLGWGAGAGAGARAGVATGAATGAGTGARSNGVANRSARGFTVDTFTAGVVDALGAFNVRESAMPEVLETGAAAFEAT